mmetsp:Transcript_54623/g.116047  ORF Transcript_54623/g.116047 Transcript_54623/m.116047 type:complete len:230 (+) Transcript_54623:128-817(+)
MIQRFSLYAKGRALMHHSRNLLRHRSLHLDLDVPRQEEVQEQIEVAPVHDESRGEVFLLNVANPPLLGVAVKVETQRRHRHPHGHLGDLHQRDDDRVEPARAHPHGHQEVVPVHDRVDGVVHGHEEQPRGGGRDVAVPAEEEDGHVMVPVQEDEGLLVHDDEERVQQLGELAEDEELDPEAGGARAVHLHGVAAHDVSERVGRQIVKQMRGGAERADGREERQQEVPRR